MNHVIHPFKRALHALIIAHIADKKAQPVLVLDKIIRHHPLFELVARIDDDLLGIVVRQRIFCKASAK